MLGAATSPIAQHLIERMIIGPVAQSGLSAPELRAARRLVAGGFAYVVGYGTERHPAMYLLAEAGSAMVGHLDLVRESLYNARGPELEDHSEAAGIAYIRALAASALLEPRRVQILLALMLRPHTYGELATTLGPEEPTEFHARTLIEHNLATGYPRVSDSGAHFIELRARDDVLVALVELAYLLVTEYHPDASVLTEPRAPVEVVRDLADARDALSRGGVVSEVRGRAALALISALTPSEDNNLPAVWHEVMDVLRYDTYHHILQRIGVASDTGRATTATLARDLDVRHQTISARLSTLRAMGLAASAGAPYSAWQEHWLLPVAVAIGQALRPLLGPVRGGVLAGFSLSAFVDLLSGLSRQRILECLLVPGARPSAAALEAVVDADLRLHLENLRRPGLVRKIRDGRSIAYVCGAAEEARLALREALALDRDPHRMNHGPRPLLGAMADAGVQHLIGTVGAIDPSTTVTEAEIAQSLGNLSLGGGDVALRDLLSELVAKGVLRLEMPAADPGTWRYSLSAEARLIRGAIAEIASLPERESTPVQSGQRACSLVSRPERLLCLLLLARQSHALTAAEVEEITGNGGDGLGWLDLIGLRRGGDVNAQSMPRYQVPSPLGESVRRLLSVIAHQAGGDVSAIDAALDRLQADDLWSVKEAVRVLWNVLEGPVAGLWEDVTQVLADTQGSLQLLHLQTGRDAAIPLRSLGTDGAGARQRARVLLCRAGLMSDRGEVTAFGRDVVECVSRVSEAIAAAQPTDVIVQRAAYVLAALDSPIRKDILRLVRDRGAITLESISTTLGVNCSAAIPLLLDTGLVTVAGGWPYLYDLPAGLRQPLETVLAADCPGGHYYGTAAFAWQLPAHPHRAPDIQ